MNDTERLIAIHEAGHVLARYMLKSGRFRYVTIVPGQDGYGGHVAPYRTSLPDPISAQLDVRVENTVRKLIITLLAGGIAVELYGNGGDSGADEDLANAAGLAFSYVCESEEETVAYIQWLTIKTRKMLFSPSSYAAVLALASELLKHKTIQEKRAYAIIRTAVWDTISKQVAESGSACDRLEVVEVQMDVAKVMENIKQLTSGGNSK